jgi:protein-tyrosine kinase
MSLVERALKKLQESRAAAQPTSPGVVPGVPAAVKASVAARPAAPAGPRPMTHVDSSRVVAIDRERLREMNLLPPANMERPIASQYQHIKRPLVSSALGGSLGPAGHVVMLASALPGEGKTFTTINLALSLALEKEMEVLLVDADVAKPHVSRIFGIEEERGLIDLLVDHQLHPNQLILRTSVPGLTILPAGQPIETATELLASARMGEIVRQLAAPDGRRIVLFDSPPLLLTTESRVLAASSGQVVLVVRAELTSRHAVQDAIDAIPEGKPISLILNQANTPASSGYYGYGSYGDSSADPHDS